MKINLKCIHVCINIEYFHRYYNTVSLSAIQACLRQLLWQVSLKAYRVPGEPGGQHGSVPAGPRNLPLPLHVPHVHGEVLKSTRCSTGLISF